MARSRRPTLLAGRTGCGLLRFWLELLRQRLELLRLLLERLRQQLVLVLLQRLPLEPKRQPMLARQRMPELLPER
ncbi:hypothetical protein D9M09_20795 [Janthinobacterium agaricidamnosum]|uniref:Uncharacterized protein n=1 Tax=Janthinobacterium agaricidamnosum TaxID=55508 RepID=A0A3G2EDD9_9BURK|nr:hypothetical protein D9M09_20795 [Janthinobacterium agaricidamnosum]